MIKVVIYSEMDLTISSEILVLAIYSEMVKEIHPEMDLAVSSEILVLVIYSERVKEIHPETDKAIHSEMDKGIHSVY